MSEACGICQEIPCNCDHDLIDRIVQYKGYVSVEDIEKRLDREIRYMESPLPALHHGQPDILPKPATMHRAQGLKIAIELIRECVQS